MSPHRHESLRYRPALDGLRGLAVLGVLMFHLWPDTVKGGWLGVDLFFVLSGYLITTLLVREYVKYGRIDLIGFWTARMRRLLPTLVVVLLATLAAAWVWTIPSRRGSVAWDAIATLFYFANWRLLFGDEAYFGAVASPSPLRHAWSLAIEEQFYLVFPLLLLILVRLFHRRRHLAWALAVLAIASAVLMTVLYVPGVDPTRVYYGTDTRAFELLIGAVAGAWVGPSQWGHDAPGRWLLAVEKLAWPALALLVVWFFAVDESVEALFRGGLVAFCLVALVTILAAASPHPNAFQHALSFEWLRRLGLISYALYLWHWPIHVFLTPDNTQVSSGLAPLLQAALSVLMATLTYRYVESPIRKRGLSGFVVSRPAVGRIVAAAAVVGVLLAAWQLPNTKAVVSTAATGSGGADLDYRMHDYVPSKKLNVILIGNSIPHSMVAHFPTTKFPDLTVRESTSFGCAPFPGDEVPQKGKIKAVSAECQRFHANWMKGTSGNDVAVFYIPQTLLHDYRVNGKILTAGTPQHDAFIRTTLDDMKTQVGKWSKAKLVIATLACHQVPVFGSDSEVSAMNNISKVRHLNSIVTRWAASNKVPVADQYGFLCSGNRYHGKINGIDLYEDAMHFTDESAPIAWNWLAPQLHKAAG